MISVGMKIVYRGDVYIFEDIELKDDVEYYKLKSIAESNLTTRVPVSMANKHIRELLTREELDQLIAKIPNIPTLEVDAKNKGAEYREKLSTGTHEDIISVIKTIHLRQVDQATKKKRVSETDRVYMRQAEHLFYNEVAYIIDKNLITAKEYVTKTIEE